MTPEQAFDTGARVYLSDATLVHDSYGRFLVGTVETGSHAETVIGDKLITSYVIKEIDPDIFLMRNGFTVFVERWKAADPIEIGRGP